MNCIIYDHIRGLPDDMEGFMSVEHSVMVLNSWCREQDIKPTYFVALVQALMLGRGHRKTGIYMRGGDASKLFSPFARCGAAGAISDGWENLRGHSMILGRDVTIGSINAAHYDALLLTKPLVVVTANEPDHRLTAPCSDAEKMTKARFYFFEDLTDESEAMKSCYGDLHPKMFVTARDFTVDDYDLALQQQTAAFPDDPVRHHVPFKTLWIPPNWARDKMEFFYHIHTL